MIFRQNFSRRYFIVLAAAVIIFGTGWWYFNQIRIFESEKNAGWELYKNEKLGFSVQYPADWKVAEVITEIDPITNTQPSGMEFAVFEEKGPPKEGITGLGKKVMVDNWITRWEVYPYFGGKQSLQITDVEILIANIGKDFKDRREERENVSVAGKSGLRVVVTSFSDPTKIEEVVFFKNRDTVYVIRNLDVTGSKEKFKMFYESFRFAAI